MSPESQLRIARNALQASQLGDRSLWMVGVVCCPMILWSLMILIFAQQGVWVMLLSTPLTQLGLCWIDRSLGSLRRPWAWFFAPGWLLVLFAGRYWFNIPLAKMLARFQEALLYAPVTQQAILPKHALLPDGIGASVGPIHLVGGSAHALLAARTRLDAYALEWLALLGDRYPGALLAAGHGAVVLIGTNGQVLGLRRSH